MCIDKLDIVNEYSNTYYRTIKMKPVDVKDNTYIDFLKKVNDKDPKFKVGDYVRISKYKNIFAKGVKKFLYLKKLQIHFHGHMLLMISMMKKLLEHFMKKNCKRLIKNNSELKKYLRKRVINSMLNGKVMIIHLIVGLKRFSIILL